MQLTRQWKMKMKDSCYRKIQMLRMLNKQRGTAEIKKMLKEQGFDVDVRTIQRDLNSLSKLFDIENDGSTDKLGWRWKKDAEQLLLPDMSPSVALSFRMIKLYLSKLIPPNTLEALKPYFKSSENSLKNLSTSKLSDWDSKIALLSRNQPLHGPIIEPSLLSNVYDALLSGKQLDVIYKPRNGKPSEYSISPRGIVVVDQITYLVGTLWEYEDIRQFALHRFQSAKASDRANHPLKNVFDLKEYINKGNFEYIDDEQHDVIKLQIKISKGIANHLNESKLSDDQIISETPEGLILTATTKNTKQLRWWLLGFGDGVEIIKPTSIRDEFKEITRKMFEKYN